MAFDFPSSPAEGQIFNAPGGPSYVFNSPVWKAVGQGQIAIISDTPPASPANGALWYESDSGVLYIWYNDGNSSQWVQVGGVASGPTVRQTILTAPTGNYVKPVGLRFLEVTVVGGGGAGSRAGATGAGQASAGGGGGGGATCISLYNASDLAASEPYTVGAAGVGGTAPGTAGGNSTFKGMTAGGGSGGGALMTAVAAWQMSARGGGGGASGGQINIGGGGGGIGLANPFIVGNAIGGVGGNSYFAGAQQTSYVGASAGTGGGAALGYGGGSGGGANGASMASGAATNDGGPGVIVLKEYF